MSDLAALALAVALVAGAALVVVAALVVAARRGHRVHLEVDVNGRPPPDDAADK